MNAQSLHIHINGRTVPDTEPAVRALDRGLLYGDGLFETLRTYSRVPFRLRSHIERLNASAHELRFAHTLDADDARAAIAELLDLNGLADAYVRLTLTRGIHRGPLELTPAGPPTLCIIAKPIRPLPPERYDPGSSAIVASVRQNADSPTPRHKTLNYLDKLLARTEARERGAHEAILLNTRGEVAEAASSSLFIVVRGRLITPTLDANILPGVTRHEILRLAAQAGLPADQRTVDPRELAAADEAFLTNSVAEIVPLRSINGATVGAGTPGPITRQIQAEYRRCIENAQDPAHAT